MCRHPRAYTHPKQNGKPLFFLESNLKELAIGNIEFADR
jgi:hypothetical protein